MEYLTFALAKGRLAEKSMEILEKIGITCEEMKEDSRKLIFINEKLGYKFFLAKASDVPTYVEKWKCRHWDCGKRHTSWRRQKLIWGFRFKNG